MDVRIEPSWKQQLQEEFDKPYFEKLVTFVKDEYKRAHVLPLGHQIFHIQFLSLRKGKSSYPWTRPLSQSRTILWSLFFCA